MPGRHITDCQMRLYMKLRHTNTIPIAAAKAGFSSSTAYRIDKDPRRICRRNLFQSFS